MLAYLGNMNELRATSCTLTDGGYKADAEVVKLYTPADVRTMVDIFTHEEDKQKANILTLRSTITNCLKDESNFSGLNKIFTDTDSLVDLLNPYCLTNAEMRMNDYAVEEVSQKLINVNILEKLSQESEWEVFIERMCKDAQVLVENDGVETGADQIITSMVQLGLPKFDDKFRTQVIDKVKSEFAGAGYSKVDVYNTSDSQLVILTGKTSFPLRYVRTVKKLKECYDDFTKNDLCNYKIVHTESFERPLPSLYNKSQDELREELYPMLLLAYCIPGIIGKRSNAETGAVTDSIACKSTASGAVYCFNRDDRPDDRPSSYIDLGADIRQTLDMLSKRENDVMMIDALISQQLKNKFIHNTAKQTLTDAIKKFLNAEVSEAYNNNESDKQFLSFVKAADMLFEKELKLK
jgi:hypothetical protein